MILDRLENASRYCSLHPGFRTAFEFLRKASLLELPDGRHELAGDRLFVNLMSDTGKARQDAKPEFHKRYIDIQVALDRSEEIGWRPTATCSQIHKPYDEEKDIGFFAEPSESWITLAPGLFVVFFPEDAHAPLVFEGNIRKAVAKIAVDW